MDRICFGVFFQVLFENRQSSTDMDILTEALLRSNGNYSPMPNFRKDKDTYSKYRNCGLPIKGDLIYEFKTVSNDKVASCFELNVLPLLVDAEKALHDLLVISEKDKIFCGALNKSGEAFVNEMKDKTLCSALAELFVRIITLTNNLDGKVTIERRWTKKEKYTTIIAKGQKFEVLDYFNYDSEYYAVATEQKTDFLESENLYFLLDITPRKRILSCRWDIDELLYEKLYKFFQERNTEKYAF